VQAASATAPADRPGLLDREFFRPHWSVEFWRDFSIPATISDPDTPLPSRWAACLLLALHFACMGPAPGTGHA
jgi:hypothetical protein